MHQALPRCKDTAVIKIYAGNKKNKINALRRKTKFLPSRVLQSISRKKTINK